MVEPSCIETIVLQPTPFCNIACDYCYLPNRQDRSTMTLDTVQTVFERVFASGWAAPFLNVIWHAGEPLVLPPRYYRDAFERIARMLPPETGVRHAVQTNGMLISPDWCDLFLRYDVGVGVSIDGPRHLHDRHRRTRNGQGTFDRTLAGIRMLRERRVPFHVISVLSRDSLDDPDAYLDFYLAEGIDQVCFNVEESEGDHVSGLFARTDLLERFSDFLQRFWRGARQSGRFTFVREIDGLLPRILRPEGTEMSNEQVTPFSMLNVACNGDVSTFSPELLGLKDARYGDFIVGNVHRESLAAMRDSAAMRRMARDIAQGVEACREACPYFSVCGGGAPINKLTENGSFASARTRFCELTQIVPTDIILDTLERIDPASRFPPPPAPPSSIPPRATWHDPIA
ncbi:MAG TPA: cyclophane-forming radical SAM/SPASM peptide maturase GrrM/OscB [Rhodopila sp.]|uniref:cyclophane-forming radical SAM/SPASM peptide maturase GrrM/OscB n=1 Tax=Rhodopila sp. TaxID=2480087 RepID=UPI002CF115B8|nr:cyclophane-forming radical SAM/SPASM peptide maturase GrrM/OscB [Rhodopila sp.]HVY16964.1 cyclophane-forming radical SAM/SPASM peptide maturase GrrM/OscB [Rhodopila sp.]